jgi:hypothetical protein
LLNRSRAWAAALLSAVFLAGVAIGWAAEEWRDGSRRHNRHRGTDAMVSYLDRKLSLTPPQRESVRAVLQRYRPATSALWREVRPRLDSLRETMQAEIAAQFDPERQARYLQLLAAKKHRDRERRARADTGRRR